MTAILHAIYCFLQDILFMFQDMGLGHWDSLLSTADSMLSTLGGEAWTFESINTNYTWILGATGMAEVLAIHATALGIRFLLQTVPFVRWGS